jgi:putative FmdB family regulatory protein|tara:strand:- start:301 stop:618 length:318 start_codon:yes stop_codon:yes gene_type:complete
LILIFFIIRKTITDFERVIMPTYDYACDKCGYTFEEQLPIADRKVPEGHCMECNDGDVRQSPAVPGFAYDNISSPGHKKSTPLWMKDRLKDIKRNTYKSTMNIPE